MVVRSLSGPLDQPVRLAVGPARQVYCGTRPSGRTWLMGPACQASVGTRLWDLAVGPARQVSCGTRLPGQIWLMGPARQAVLGPARGTHCQSQLVGPSCQVSWWDLGIRLKFTNLNSHVDMTHRRIAEVSV
jgi:hypothetical protein